MLVLSLKASTLKVVATLAALAVVVAAASWEGNVAHTLTSALPQAASEAAETGLAAGADLSTNEKRVAFLKSLGWEVDEEPVEIVEVVIPQTFNAVYKNYNEIQKAQGFDLTKYRGARAKRWTYNVKNYPGAAEGIHANLLIYKNKLIGGDVSSVAINGFMQGLSPNSTKTSVEVSKADIVSESFKNYEIN